MLAWGGQVKQERLAGTQTATEATAEDLRSLGLGRDGGPHGLLSQVPSQRVALPVAAFPLTGWKAPTQATN